VILGQTGGGAFVAKAEAEALQGVATVVNQQQGGVNGRPIHFTISDDQSDPSVDVQIANRLIAQKVAVILGPTLVASCSAIAPLLTDGPVMYCLSPGIHPDAGSYAFSSGVSTADMAAKLIAYYRAQGWTRIAAITSTDATGQDAESSINAALARPENSSLQLVANEHFNTTDVSVDAQISRIKGAGPQAMIAWSTGNAIATVFKGIQQGGLDIPVATTDGNMTYAQMQQYADFLPRTLLIPSGQWPAYDSLPAGPEKDAQKAFYDALQAQGIKPEIGHVLAWDPALVVVDALRKLGPDASAQQIRDELNSLTNFPGADGLHDYTSAPQRGLTIDDVVVTQWDAGQGTWKVVYQ
jgi:branched-chain amino acid transport system substrate-binding protein